MPPTHPPSSSSSKFQVAILTVSDTASEDASADLSGPKLASYLSEHPSGLYAVAERKIVPDSTRDIRSAVEAWVSQESQVDLVVTSGGTAFGVRDYTPEALSPLITRPSTGLVHLILSYGLTKTPLAALSRPVAGATATDRLIITFPGSVKAGLEGLEAVTQRNVLAHALELLRGKRTPGEVVRHQPRGSEQHPTIVQADYPHSHSHPHDQHHHDHHHPHHAHGHHAPISRTLRSNDPSQPVSGRQRTSPYPIISMSEAFEHIFKHASVLGTVKRSVGPRLVGHVLAENILSVLDVPGGKSTNVDGYAVRAADGEGTYPILTSATQSSSSAPIPAGYIYRINTGALLPAGTDSVVMVEDTEVASRTEEGEEKAIKVLAKVDEGENVRKPGSDVRKGEQVMAKGETIEGTGGDVGTLAFVGRTQVLVYRRPIVALLSTGNELSDLSSAASSSLTTPTYDTNRPALATALDSLGYDCVDLGIVGDTVLATEQGLRNGIKDADVIITTGGTSMGEADLLKPVIERKLEGKIHFGRVAMKPGKPTTFATVKGSDERDRLIFALPGNPASALVTFFVFVLPALRKMSGYPEGQWHLPAVPVEITSDFPLDPRPEFHRVRISPGPKGLVANSTGGQRSSRAGSLGGANAFVKVPALDQGEATKKALKKGEIAEAILIGPVVSLI